MKTKKIIAREFLLLLSSLVLTAVFLLGLYIYNYQIERSINKYDKIIYFLQIEIDTLEKTYSQKIKQQNWFSCESNTYFDYGSASNYYSKIWSEWESIHKYNNDSIEFLWNNLWDIELKNIFDEIGFESWKELRDFVDDNTLSESELQNMSRVIIAQSDIDLYKSAVMNQHARKIDQNERSKLIKSFVITLLVMVFLLRYIVYAVKWSINTLKT